MNLISAFQPIGFGATVNTVVGAAATSVTLPNLASDMGIVRLVNVGTQTVFVSFTGVATVATGMPILPNAVEFITFPASYTISAIAAAVGSTLYATFGNGK